MMNTAVKTNLERNLQWDEMDTKMNQNMNVTYFDFDYLEDIMEKNLHFNEKIHRFDELKDK